MTVIPAQAGIHINENIHRLDPRLRGDDGNGAAINYAKRSKKINHEGEKGTKK